MANFYEAVEVTLKHEGGYVNDSLDPGGETNFGISKKQYPNINIKTLTKEKAIEIYYEDYWTKIRGDEIKSQKVAGEVFDASVNLGVKKAIRLLQKSLFIVDDGVFGNITMSELGKYIKKDSFIYLLKHNRIIYYINICKKRKHMRKFLYAWIKRTLEV